MRYVFSLALAGALLLAVGSTAFADNVKTDFDHGADFSKFHTYSWGKVTTANPFYVDRIKDAVNRDLQSKGWQMVPSGGDATVFATDRVHNEQELETMYDGMGGGWGGGWGWGGWGGMGGGGMGEATTNTVNQRVGHLVVDMFESNSKKLLWRGSSTADLSNNSDKNTKNLEKDVDKMLKNFPPKAGKS
ncbi:MAG TPA: DUF4136 domain-containing protein [Acidobacteriaceae bacterium]|nr:DUF4136 domain-containing protein [Acidobacteriaceae bacterium]